jgi:hypothetical protein
MPTLPRVAQDHHDRLMRHIDQMPATGDLLLTAAAADLLPPVDEMLGFLTSLLIPHMEATEKALYPELERMQQNRHSMAPLRKEHEAVRAIVKEMESQRAALGAGRLTLGHAVAMRRNVFRLYSLLKIHMEEERLYLRILEHGVTADVADVLAAALDHPAGSAD